MSDRGKTVLIIIVIILLLVGCVNLCSDDDSSSSSSSASTHYCERCGNSGASKHTFYNLSGVGYDHYYCYSCFRTLKAASDAMGLRAY